MRLLGRLRLRSLQTKIALLFFAITLVAFSVVYFVVVPALRENLEGQRQDDVTAVARDTSSGLEDVMGGDISAPRLNELVRATADRADAQVTLLGVQRSGPEGRAIEFYVISDSRAGADIAVPESVAVRAVSTDRLATKEGPADAVAAVPLRYRGRADWVAIYSRSLDEVNEAVSLIRAQVLAAGAAALLVALLGGYLIARALARRVRRIERGAEAVAAGNFIDPIPVDSEDELGQLTRTFNDMQEQLQRVDRARREFIANASHELRTPIFSLGGFVELMQEEDADEATREEWVEQMRQGVERLQKLAVDLLDLSRLDAGSVQIEASPVDLGEVVRSVASEFTPAVANRRAGLDLDLPAGAVEASADRERVAQIMRILLDNALRHTPEGVNVTVTAERENGRAELRVADTGPGIPKEDAERVFERFYTADAVSGSGLGLAIAKELAELMRGNISLSSDPVATTFTLVLPAAEE
ncbi:MAG: HAMP domain-containing histidine kinase [Thermoleophilaceae bacterium]|nr:HAMP domain-containing histidine kinase [Thermoleophilaceae bacterium]